MDITLSKHAQQRLEQRLTGVATASDVQRAIQRALTVIGRVPYGETGIIFKRLPQPVRVMDSEGDRVVAVVASDGSGSDLTVTTVELRFSRQPKPKRWSKVVDLTL